MSAELLAPAGDFETARAAFAAGADAVYCGLTDYSARAFAKNLTEDDLRHLLRLAHGTGKKVYVTFNTLVDEADFADATRRLAWLEDAGADGVIVQDLGVAKVVRERFPGLTLHASTQLVAHNLEGVLALRELGFRRVVLARELTLEEVASITKRCGVEIECFIHGALCYSLSGLCLFSALEKGRSGNRGTCAYCCRAPLGEGRTAKGEGRRVKGEGRKVKGEEVRDRGGELFSPFTLHPSPFTLFPFSMKDLRVGEGARRLAEAGVASLKIEGRMKSPLYVASVTKYYRDILDGARPTVTTADLETVFSRKTTPLYLNGRNDAADVIEPHALGHLGTPIGTVKRVTKDREGRRWLRFHTSRALEKHDGLQFLSPEGGKPFGFGITEMRQAISRVSVFEVSAGTDVEVLLEGEGVRAKGEERPSPFTLHPSPFTLHPSPFTLHSTPFTLHPPPFTPQPGETVFCSMSNAVKRRFPVPSFRASDYPGPVEIDVTVTFGAARVRAEAVARRVGRVLAAQCDGSGAFTPAQNPAATYAAVEKAFAKLGESDYRLGRLTLHDPDRLFVPPRVLNDLRRELVARLDDARKVQVASASAGATVVASDHPTIRPSDHPTIRPRRVKVRLGQTVPDGDWDEVIVQLGACYAEARDFRATLARYRDAWGEPRLALPVWTAEGDFNRLRTVVKGLLREGYGRWEAGDLATLRMLRTLGVGDVTADWTLYAFNAAALAQIAALGVRRVVASPENDAANLGFLAASGFDVEFLSEQSTPLFLSLHRPAGAVADGFAVHRQGPLWVTARTARRRFPVPDGAATRLDASWDAEDERCCAA